MTYKKSALINYKELKVGSWTFKGINGTVANVHEYGTIVFTSDVNGVTYNGIKLPRRSIFSGTWY
jgi:hypothetical protein